ncbi:MAG: vWA domain-containing protein, partial [Thermomicrobiales bacterium]
MGFLQPLALLALPLALLPLLLSWRGRRQASPQRFSSLHLFDVARRRPVPRRARRRRRVLLLRVLCVALLVLAAARPVGPGRGGPGEHRPTSLVVAVDISASVAQHDAGREAWTAIRAWGDSILALATPEDRVALAAVADGIVGWWSGSPEALRRHLGSLEPTARASDWPQVLRALEERIEDGTEAYLLTDGAVGKRRPEPRSAVQGEIEGRRALRVWESAAGINRSLAGARWATPDRVALAGRGWGAVGATVAGRLQGTALVDSSAIPLHGGVGATTWEVADSATFALAGADRLPADDRLYVARGAQRAYRVSRLAVAGEPKESGSFFWEAALAASPRGAEVGRVRLLGELTDSPPELALLPIRAYRPDEAAALAALAAGGTRLLFVPTCPEPACIP